MGESMNRFWLVVVICVASYVCHQGYRLFEASQYVKQYLNDNKKSEWVIGEVSIITSKKHGDYYNFFVRMVNIGSATCYSNSTCGDIMVNAKEQTVSDRMITNEWMIRKEGL